MKIYQVQWWGGWGNTQLIKSHITRANNMEEVRKTTGRKCWSSKYETTIDQEGKIIPPEELTTDTSPTTNGGPQITITYLCDEQEITPLNTLPKAPGEENPTLLRKINHE